jgi:hypothetical protein
MIARYGEAEIDPNPSFREFLIDHPVGEGEQYARDFEAEHLGSLLVDDQLEFGWLLG